MDRHVAEGIPAEASRLTRVRRGPPWGIRLGWKLNSDAATSSLLENLQIRQKPPSFEQSFPDLRDERKSCELLQYGTVARLMGVPEAKQLVRAATYPAR
jgi:hypothetical protein